MEKDNKLILVDGQQRTTTLLLLFYVLEDFIYKNINLNYAVRGDSNKFLKHLIDQSNEKVEDEDIQDIFFFKKAIETIDKKIIEIEKKSFAEYVKEKVWVLINRIEEDKAINTFIALNGLKAIMKQEELIKSELLIKSSRQEIINLSAIIHDAFEWRVNEDRGRLARNWDKWLYWWNQDEVKKYFGLKDSEHPLYYLLNTYWEINKQYKNGKFNFQNFKNKFLGTNNESKINFEGLRKLQKSFEDLFNNPETYNYLGLVFNCDVSKENTIQFFILNIKRKDEINRYSKWALVGCTFSEILENNVNIFYNKRDSLKVDLFEPNLYESSGKEQAYLQLLRMNIEGMFKRKFNFEEFKSKSLEHICPQNPKIEINNFLESKMDIEHNADGINSIGNLVLLNGATNSELSNNPLNKKKQLLFDKIQNGFLLPHTLKVFSKSFNQKENNSLFNTDLFWTSNDVNFNKEYFVTQFENFYE